MKYDPGTFQGQGDMFIHSSPKITLIPQSTWVKPEVLATWWLAGEEKPDACQCKSHVNKAQSSECTDGNGLSDLTLSPSIGMDGAAR